MKRLRTEDVIGFQKRLLKITGMWPSKSPTFMRNIWSALNLMAVYTNVCFMIHGLFVAGDFSQFLQNLSILIGVITSGLKVTIFYFQRSKVLKLVDFMQDPIFYFYQDDLEEHLLRSVKISTLFVRMYQVVSFVTVLFFCFIPIFKIKTKIQLPYDYGLKNFIETSRLSYVLLYIFQGCSIFSLVTNTTASDAIAISLMGVSAAYFKILQETIKQSTCSPTLQTEENAEMADYTKFNDEAEQKLRKCIDFHLALITLVETIEEIFTYFFLLLFLASGISICLAGFTFSLAAPGSYEYMTALSCFVSYMFQIALYCVYGEEVTQQSLQVGEACYMTEWMYYSPKVRKSLFFIMERSKRASIFTAGKFVNLAHSSLLAALRSAYSYGAVLQQLNKK